MNSAKINDWLQVIGLFGVIGSLIFVGLQMKQEQEIARSAASQARTENTINSIDVMASNAYFMAAVDKLETGEESSLTPSERRALFYYRMVTLYNFENIHYQHLNGFIEDERWRGSRETLKFLLATAQGPRDVYETNPEQWRTSFRQAVDELIAEIDAEGNN